MLDIENEKYASRKEYEYDDDIAILFYKGEKIAKAKTESFRKSWIEEADYFDNITDFLEDVTGKLFNIDENDNSDNWEHIWDELEWKDDSKSYKFGNWEWIVLDI